MNFKKQIKYREKCHNKRIKTSCGKYVKKYSILCNSR